MISVGGGAGLLCLAVVGVIMSDRPWVKVLSALYLAAYGIGVVVQVVREQWNPGFLIVPLLLVLLGMYVHSVEHMFDPKETTRK